MLGLGTGLPLIGGGGTVEYLTNISRGQAIPHEYLTNTGSCLFWGEFRPSRKFLNTFDVKIPQSGHDLHSDNNFHLLDHPVENKMQAGETEEDPDVGTSKYGKRTKSNQSTNPGAKTNPNNHPTRELQANLSLRRPAEDSWTQISPEL